MKRKTLGQLIPPGNIAVYEHIAQIIEKEFSQIGKRSPLSKAKNEMKTAFSYRKELKETLIRGANLGFIDKTDVDLFMESYDGKSMADDKMMKILTTFVLMRHKGKPRDWAKSFLVFCYVEDCKTYQGRSHYQEIADHVDSNSFAIAEDIKKLYRGIDDTHIADLILGLCLFYKNKLIPPKLADAYDKQGVLCTAFNIDFIS